MKTLAFLKGKVLNFLVKPVSKETPSAPFSTFHPSGPLRIMGLLEIEMPRLRDFQHPQRPVTLFCYGSDPFATELPRILKNWKYSDQKPVLSHEAPCDTGCISAVLEGRGWPKYLRVRGSPYKGGCRCFPHG